MKKFNPATFFLISLLSLAVFLFLGSCAGGSSGTGIKEFTGKVIATDGRPLAGLEVTVVETGATAITDADGSFSIQTSVGGGDAVLNVVSEGVVSSVPVENLPSGNATISVDLEVDETDNTVGSSIIEVTSEEPSEPTDASGGSASAGSKGGGGSDSSESVESTDSVASLGSAGSGASTSAVAGGSVSSRPEDDPDEESSASQLNSDGGETSSAASSVSEDDPEDGSLSSAFSSVPVSSAQASSMPTSSTPVSSAGISEDDPDV